MSSWYINECISYKEDSQSTNRVHSIEYSHRNNGKNPSVMLDMEDTLECDRGENMYVVSMIASDCRAIYIDECLDIEKENEKNTRALRRKNISIRTANCTTRMSTTR